MQIIKTNFKGLLIYKRVSHIDSRGYFRELFLEKQVKSKLKFFVVSKSKKNVLRGLHFQLNNPQGKYLSVIKGKIFDVAVDCRPKSKTLESFLKLF